MTADLIAAVARGFIGTKESPKNSNNVVFNTHYYGREVSGSAYPWCVVFVWDVFRLADASPLFYGGGKTASCTELMSYAKKNSQFVTGGYKKGDIILYNWSGAKTSADHTGIVTADSNGATVSAVEGNTSVTDESNGGEVLERVRNVSLAAGAYRPAYSAPQPALSYAEFTALMARYLAESSGGDTHSPWADAATRYTREQGIFNGDGSGNFNWTKPLTRESAAQIIYNIMHKGENNG